MTYRIVMQPSGVLAAHCQEADDERVGELAEECAEDMRRIVPVDSGDLRKTIRVEPTTVGSRAIVAGGEGLASDGGDVDYPVYVEQGTRYMAAQPFMRPALYRLRS